MNQSRLSLGLAALAFALGGTALLGFGIYALVRPKPPSGPTAALSVLEPERDLGALPCEQERLVKFRITNNSSRPLGVLGAAIT